MDYQLERKLEENAKVSVQEAVFSIDQALGRMEADLDMILPLAGKPCDQVLDTLEQRVANSPHLRSLILTRDQQAYCATDMDPLPYISAFSQSGRQTELAFDAPSSPNAAIIKIQRPHNDPGVIATAYGRQLRDELRAFQDGLTLLLEFNDLYIWSEGDSRDAQRPSQVEFTEQTISQKYGYVVIGGYPKGYAAQEFRISLHQVLPSLVLVGVASMFIMYLGLTISAKKKD
ncbi:CSS-motif domain-containing protein [Pseudomonas putida]|uniref:CSS-motif domain-containing protein n=1 Tax=Pseudomonas putida TaxID=303 RepID=UPI002AC78E11|nr:CSS-motif domain-containing protein [Pseudomonas putida]MDZ5111195.1 CSS-motif domain-containing protein [Pseudomonas putida]